jgi:hypothetical protein
MGGILAEPPHVAATELFPELSDEIDRRISHAETRIKFWVMAGIAVNLLVAVAAAIPLVFSMGQISRDISVSTSTQQAQAIELVAQRKWMADRQIWEVRVESALQNKGIDLSPAPLEQDSRR